MANCCGCLFVIIGFVLNQQFTAGELFRAGVVEYYYDIANSANATEKDIFLNNLNNYVTIIGMFGDADTSVEKGIIVFPECGLTKERISDKDLFIQVPEPSYNNTNFNGNQVMSKLSEAAINNKLWVVVNLMEQHGTFRYNTDVVFRSNGTIAARYRKYNLFGEPLNTTVMPEVVSFVTDFGVTFGIFTCFDILYSHPAQDLVKQGIKHFIFPTAWYSELPFLSAVQYQMAWAYANDVTLLASGLGFAPYGNTGSGIYLGKNGQLLLYQTTVSNSSYILSTTLDSSDQGFSDNKTSNIIPAVLPKADDRAGKTDDGGLKLLKESLHAYSTELMEASKCSVDIKNLGPDEVEPCTETVKRTLCNRGLCCEFEVTAVYELALKGNENTPKQNQQDDFSLSFHRLAVLDGVRSFTVATGGVQTCAVVPCRNEDVASCGLAPQQRILPQTVIDDVHILRKFITEVKIEGDFLQEEGGKETFITPNLLLGHISSNDPTTQFGRLSQNFTFSVDKKRHRVKFHFGPIDNFDYPLGTAGIWSRVYNRDGQPESAASTITSRLSIYFVVLLGAVYLYEH